MTTSIQKFMIAFYPVLHSCNFDSVSNFLFPHCRLFAMRYFEPPIDWLLVINCISYLLLCLCMSAVAWISVQYGVALAWEERMGRKTWGSQSNAETERGDIEAGTSLTLECYIRIWKAGGEHAKSIGCWETMCHWCKLVCLRIPILSVPATQFWPGDAMSNRARLISVCFCVKMWWLIHYLERNRKIVYPYPSMIC